MISGAIVAWEFELLPRWALAVLGAREALMLLLTRMALRRGLDIEINTLGRWAVWPTMSALAVAMIAETWLSDVLLYVGLAMTLAAGDLHQGRPGRIAAGRTLKLYLRIALYSLLSSSRKEPQAPMETFPDLSALSDQELKDMIQQLSEEENAVSYRGSCTARSTSCGPSSSTGCEKHAAGESVISGADVQRLTQSILASKTAPADQGAD